MKHKTDHVNTCITSLLREYLHTKVQSEVSSFDFRIVGTNGTRVRYIEVAISGVLCVPPWKPRRCAQSRDFSYIFCGFGGRLAWNQAPISWCAFHCTRSGGSPSFRLLPVLIRFGFLIRSYNLRRGAAEKKEFPRIMTFCGRERLAMKPLWWETVRVHSLGLFCVNCYFETFCRSMGV